MWVWPKNSAATVFWYLSISWWNDSEYVCARQRHARDVRAQQCDERLRIVEARQSRQRGSGVSVCNKEGEGSPDRWLRLEARALHSNTDKWTNTLSTRQQKAAEGRRKDAPMMYTRSPLFCASNGTQREQGAAPKRQRARQETTRGRLEAGQTQGTPAPTAASVPARPAARRDRSRSAAPRSCCRSREQSRDSTKERGELST